jgi:hypothetical protein
MLNIVTTHLELPSLVMKYLVPKVLLAKAVDFLSDTSEPTNIDELFREKK